MFMSKCIGVLISRMSVVCVFVCVCVDCVLCACLLPSALARDNIPIMCVMAPPIHLGVWSMPYANKHVHTLQSMKSATLHTFEG